jgi:archaemetzincin
VASGNHYRIHREKFSSSVLLVPCGPVEQEDLKFLTRALSERGMKVSIGAERKVPTAAFNRVRRQYRGELFLKSAQEGTFDRVLAVTNYDLYSNNLNFVFGLADAREKSAVISLFRLRMGADEETFHNRTVKEAVHELGHTWGLPHCQNPRCVMHFSNSLEDTDRKQTEWCGRCGARL